MNNCKRKLWMDINKYIGNKKIRKVTMLFIL